MTLYICVNFIGEATIFETVAKATLGGDDDDDDVARREGSVLIVQLTRVAE